MTYLVLYCVQSDRFYSIQIWSIKQYFICENRSQDVLNHHKLCEIANVKNILVGLIRIFCGGTLSRIPLKPVLISIKLYFVDLNAEEWKLWCSEKNNYCMPAHAYLVSGMRLFTCHSLWI